MEGDHTPQESLEKQSRELERSQERVREEVGVEGHSSYDRRGGNGRVGLTADCLGVRMRGTRPKG